jgi:hypothetical protein
LPKGFVEERLKEGQNEGVSIFVFLDS